MSTVIKVMAISIILLDIASMALFALKKIGALLFWIIIIFSALIAYKGIPYLNKKHNKY